MQSMLDKAAVSSVLVEVQRLVESVQSMLDKAAVSSMLVEVQRLVESVHLYAGRGAEAGGIGAEYARLVSL